MAGLRSIRATCLGAALICALPGAAVAQDLGGALDLGQLGTSIGVGHAIGQIGRRHARQSAKRGAPAPAAGRLDYAVTPALKRQALGAFLDRMRARNPAQAVALERSFARVDYDRIYRSVVAPYGLRGDDLADSVTAYTVLGWLVANGQQTTSPASVRLARARIAAQLSGDPRFASPEQRASLGEEMKILFVVVHGGWQSSAREGTARAYGDSVAQLFRQQFGMDLRRLSLNDGLKPHG